MCVCVSFPSSSRTLHVNGDRRSASGAWIRPYRYYRGYTAIRPISSSHSRLELDSVLYCRRERERERRSRDQNESLSHFPSESNISLGLPHPRQRSPKWVVRNRRRTNSGGCGSGGRIFRIGLDIQGLFYYRALVCRSYVQQGVILSIERLI